MSASYSIAIIGLGPTGACFLSELLARLDRCPPKPLVRITIIDPSKHLGHGYAFHSDQALNMRANTMSIMPDDPADFTRWINHRSDLPTYRDYDYPPRRVFGDYIESKVQKALGLSREKIAVTHWPTSAIDIELAGNKRCVVCSNDQKGEFSCVVVTVGESRHNAFCVYRGHHAFAPSPWDLDLMSSVPRNARVAVLGSSLSAVDTCLELLERGHAGEITCVSRRRGFPKIQGRYEVREPTIMDAEWLDRITRAGDEPLTLGGTAIGLKIELDNCADEPYQLGAADPREWFSQAGHAKRWRRDEGEVFLEALEVARASSTPWYYLLDALAPLTPAIWSRLRQSDRDRMLAKYYSLWCEYRHSMPIINATKLEPAVSSGQLRVRRGFRSARPVPGTGRRSNWELVIEDGHATATPVEAYDWLIDATGGRVSLACEREPLLVNTIKSGVLRQDRVGGIDVTYGSCRAVRSDSSCWEDIFVVGPLTFGTHFYTNSFDTNRDHAFHVASQIEHLLDGVREERPVRVGSDG